MYSNNKKININIFIWTILNINILNVNISFILKK